MIRSGEVLANQKACFVLDRSTIRAYSCELKHQSSENVMPISTQGELLLKLTALHAKNQRQLAGPLSCHGISFSEYLVLRQLYLAPGKKLRRVDLAQQVGLSASGVTRLLNPMEKTGLISKEEAARDARVSLVSLTSAGERVLKDADVSFDQVAQSVLEPLNCEDQNNLLRMADELL